MTAQSGNLGIHRAKVVLSALLLLPALAAVAVFALAPIGGGHSGVRAPLVIMSLLICAGIIAAFWAKPFLAKAYGAALAVFGVPFLLNVEESTQGSSNLANELWVSAGTLLVAPAVVVALIAAGRWIFAGFTNGKSG